MEEEGSRGLSVSLSVCVPGGGGVGDTDVIEQQQRSQHFKRGREQDVGGGRAFIPFLGTGYIEEKEFMGCLGQEGSQTFLRAQEVALYTCMYVQRGVYCIL